MNRIWLALLLCATFFIRCDRQEAFTSNQFIVTYLGASNPCTEQQIRFEERDFARLRAVLDNPEIHDGWFGTRNLTDSFQAGQKVRVTIRPLKPEEDQPCLALYLMLRRVYVIEAVPYQAG
ncbi:hypothetical protein SAMN05421747_103228 [Parapedobacter composti]|uniref:Uncharacterized protein n=1 Tax=Parapedobacter composti TaxID=623281 RepID=A0A1I1FY63_9SPHI|nr:hypothetical protein [Parapedobacter composti]SFC04211.1 hypothetical protein SAMN05421747_103228 [Parapedobacter composti]